MTIPITTDTDLDGGFNNPANAPSGNSGTFLSRVGEAITGSNDDVGRTHFQYFCTDDFTIASGGRLAIESRSVHFSESTTAYQLLVQDGGTLKIGSSFLADGNTINSDGRCYVKLPGNVFAENNNQSSYREENSSLRINSNGSLEMQGVSLETASPITWDLGANVVIRDSEIRLNASSEPNARSAQIRQYASVDIDGLTVIGGAFSLIGTFTQIKNYSAINMQAGIAFSSNTPEGTYIFSGYSGAGNQSDAKLKTNSSYATPNVLIFSGSKVPLPDLKIDVAHGGGGRGIFRGEYTFSYSAFSLGSPLESANLLLEDNSGTQYVRTSSASGQFSQIDVLEGFYEKLISGGPEVVNAPLTLLTPITGYVRRYGFFDVLLNPESYTNIVQALAVLPNPLVDTSNYPLASIAAIAGISYNSGGVTVSASKTWAEAAHWLEYSVTQVDYRQSRYWAFQTTGSGQLDADLVIGSGADIGNDGRIAMGPGTTVTLGDSAAPSILLDMSATCVINVDAAPLVVDLSNWTFADGASFEITDGGDVTITVADSTIAAQLDGNKVETNGTITFQGPQITATFTGIIDGAEGRAKQGSKTLKHEQNITSGSFVYAPNPVDDPVTYVFSKPGFRPVIFNNLSITASSTLEVEFEPDPSYIV